MILSSHPPATTADTELVVHGPDGDLLGRVGLWWTDVPTIPDTIIGCLGSFEASGPEAARLLLEGACARLREAGCTRAIGPMDGNTWRPHRFVIEDSGEPPFLLEPRNPPEYPSYFSASGFEILATYRASLLPLDEPAPDFSLAAGRLEERGITIRDLDPTHFRQELGALYDVCLACFSENFLYTPISRAEFIDSYSRVEPLVDPGLIRIAEHAGTVIGFLFALPDQHERVLVKTLAVDPHHRRIGLGSVLVAQVQQRARESGFRHAIHAIQHEKNSSRHITGQYAFRVIRRYALYHRSLQP